MYTFYGLDGTLLYRRTNWNLNFLQKTDYVAVSGLQIVRVENRGGSNVRYLFQHDDHLGSVVAETERDGSVKWQEDSMLFGEKRGNSGWGTRSHPGFTGHFGEGYNDLVYMQARFYDPIVGRFLSNDPVGFTQSG